jgi:hypothetical protein
MAQNTTFLLKIACQAYLHHLERTERFWAYFASHQGVNILDQSLSRDRYMDDCDEIALVSLCQVLVAETEKDSKIWERAHRLLKAMVMR